jgi:hypothetical protein
MRTSRHGKRLADQDGDKIGKLHDVYVDASLTRRCSGL